MIELSHQKLQEIRKSKGYTYEKLAKLTDISRSTIEKIFSGANNNPTINYLKKIAMALDCGIDDFLDFDTEPVSPYYLDRKTGELAEQIYENIDLRNLLEASKNLSSEDIQAIIMVINRIKLAQKI